MKLGNILLFSCLLMVTCSMLPSMNFFKGFSVMGVTSKRIKAATAVSAAVLLSIPFVNEAKYPWVTRKYTAIRDGLTPCDDPKILELVDTIKEDFGIKEKIPVLKTKKTGLFGSVYDNNIGLALNLEKIGNDGSLLIQTIAHELTHYLQKDKKSGNWQSIQPNQNIFQNIFWQNSTTQQDKINCERDADANACRYLKCKDCLTHLAEKLGQINRHHMGYLSKNDYQPYIDCATEHNWQCAAHKAGTHLDPNTPLKDFLPTKRKD